jgi:SAM-dependent methyltransferase
MPKETEVVNAQATSEDFEFESLAQAVNYRRALIREFSPYLNGSILEVGSGIGQFTSELVLVPGVKSLHAVEPDSRFYSALLARNLKIQSTCGTVSDLDSQSKYDSIVSVNVLEHIENHSNELKKYHELVRAGGHLCLFVPACPAIYAPIDKSFGHFRRYRREELRELLERAGFQIIKLHYFNSLGFFAWWFNFCFLKKDCFEVGKVKFYDRFLFPLVHTMESSGSRPPLGQSLLAICQV